MHMLDIMRCTPWGTNWGYYVSDDVDDRVSNPEAWLESLNADTGLLWYLTFLNYSCEVETDETEDVNGNRWAHVTIYNTDMVKLLYEELEKTEQLVTEDRREAASEAMTDFLEYMKDYFKNKAKNKKENQYIHVTAYPASGDIVVRPVYGDDMITTINVSAAVSGIVFEGIGYVKNEMYWQNLTKDRTLFRYTLANMLERMENGDYRTSGLQYSRYWDSFWFADSDWGISDIARDKGIAGSNCSDSNANGDVFNSVGTARDYGTNIKNYQERIMYAIVGWRGTVYE